MTGTIIFFLFLLIVLLILAVILLYLRQNRFIEMEKNLQNIQAESEEALAAFLLEIKEENEQFINKITSIEKENYAKNAIATPFKDDEVIEKDEIKTKQEPIVQAEAYSRFLATQKYQNGVSKIEDQMPFEKTEELLEEKLVEKTFAQRVEHLSNKGLSSEEIAKNLKKGKTEIELLLKFQGISK